MDDERDSNDNLGNPEPDEDQPNDEPVGQDQEQNQGEPLEILDDYNGYSSRTGQGSMEGRPQTTGDLDGPDDTAAQEVEDDLEARARVALNRISQVRSDALRAQFVDRAECISGDHCVAGDFRGAQFDRDW